MSTPKRYHVRRLEPSAVQGKRLYLRVAILLLVILALCITSFALGMAVYEVRMNTFQTGGIEIDLNGGRPIITANEFLFEPGMTVVKDFYIQNKGTWAVYYKLYFSEIEGELADVLDITIVDENEAVLLTGKLSELTKGNVPALEDALEVDQRQDLQITFHFPPDAGNVYQGENLEFAVSAIAVQTKNNPNKEFE